VGTSRVLQWLWGALKLASAGSGHCPRRFLADFQQIPDGISSSASGTAKNCRCGSSDRANFVGKMLEMDQEFYQLGANYSLSLVPAPKPKYPKIASEIQ
jgi:hypothetical protein